MIAAPLPENEFERLSALASYQVLDTEPELGFDDLTALAAEICNTPIALVSLIDARRQWFKSRHGLAATETPRELAFCAHAILERTPMIVPDVFLDERFHDNPLATDEPHVRFYAGAPLIDSDGNTLGTLCVIDHVPRVLSDEQLNSLARLARQVMSLLQLRKARDTAYSAARAKSEFLANMSHEIRTPLNGVLGITQLLSETTLSEEQREWLGIAKTSGEHLLAVVNDVLDFAALEAGSVQLDKSVFNLQALVNDVINITGDAARCKGLTVNLQWCSTQSWYRIGDRHRIRQVLLNLLVNAIKFTASGSVTIIVADTDNPSLVHISVVDTGIGIAPQSMPKLFNRFVQDNSSLTRKFGGSGLGLAIVRRLVRLMGGQVHVTSEQGKGSRFWCVIPMPLDGSDSNDSLVSTTSPVYFDLAGRAVLVADDDVTNVMLLTYQLSKHNCVVTVVETGRAAIEICKTQRFDLILMDGRMPEVDGFEATGMIRELPSDWTKHVPIIAMTGSALEGDREFCLLAGMSDYLSKPLNMLALNAAFQRAFAIRDSVALPNGTGEHVTA